MNKIRIGKWEIFITLLLAVAIFFLSLFGLTGLKVFLSLVFLYFLPFFLILNNFDLDFGEKIIFSFFISLAIYPTLTYWLSFVVGSIRIAMIIVFVVVLGIGLALTYMKRKKSKRPKS